ncbi:uncharacterized protein A4U43_C07F4090 [Asparagus officinalis]|uniref:HD domain-containing protein n=1 Tax=Asparagus officinalis TaxID=4686 RepID=A0A5P1ECL0_ASPOF|nr:uncharacterized protein A4U43_C07F4090 [Asparagus officinalis]
MVLGSVLSWMRASGDTYLQHCVETALLLAKIGANVTAYLQHCVETALLLAKIGANVTVVAAGLLHDTGANVTVVAAGLLHDTLDDSYMDYYYIHRRFGAGLADLVKGVSFSSLA